MHEPLSSDIKQLLDRPNFVHLATVMADGSPQSVPVWAAREGDRIVICTGESSLKAKNTRRDPRVALSVVDLANPYVEAQLRGRVVERRPDPDLGLGLSPRRRRVAGIDEVHRGAVRPPAGRHHPQDHLRKRGPLLRPDGLAS